MIWKSQTSFRRAFDELGADAIKKNLLNKIPQELRDKLHSEGGDVVVDLDRNSFTISACSKALLDEISSKFTRKEET